VVQISSGVTTTVEHSLRGRDYQLEKKKKKTVGGHEIREIIFGVGYNPEGSQRTGGDKSEQKGTGRSKKGRYWGKR